jgi:hypothetical protein
MNIGQKKFPIMQFSLASYEVQWGNFSILIFEK